MPASLKKTGRRDEAPGRSDRTARSPLTGRPGARPSTTHKPASPSRRGAEKEEPRRKKKLQGWDSVVARSKELDERSDKDNALLRDFYLKEGEIAIVQYLDDEPYAFEGHSIQNERGHWGLKPCQLETQKHCLMCQSDSRPTWQGAMRVLDYRGNWDKEESGFLWDEPVEKIHFFGIKLAGQLKAYADKKGKPLSSLVIEIQKVGSGKASTHNLAPAMDEATEKVMRPIAWDSKVDSVEDCIIVPTDEELEKLGF